MKDRIHLIMPMGGGGTRFGNKGFGVPKPLIGLQGRPFFYWAAQSVIKRVDVQDVTFVVLQEHVNRYQIDQAILSCYQDAKVRIIPKVLAGAVLTCREGLQGIHDGMPVLFNDCDHAFSCRAFFDYCLRGEFGEYDGAILTFRSTDPAYSYVRFDDTGKIMGTVEKNAVSNEAICGAYYFKNKTVFLDAAERYLGNCSYSEYFVSGIYNEMVRQGMRLTTFPVDMHISFGTPDEYDKAVYDLRLGELG